MKSKLKNYLAKSGREFIKLVCRDLLQWNILPRRITYRTVEIDTLHGNNHVGGPVCGIDFIVIIKQDSDGTVHTQCTTVGFIVLTEDKQPEELKNRMAKCIGWTNYLLFVSSDMLVEEVEKLLDDMEAETISNRGKTGLLSLDSIFPVRVPRPLTVSSEKKAKLYELIALSSIFKETKETEIILLDDNSFMLETPKYDIRSDSEGSVELTQDQPCEKSVEKTTSIENATQPAEQKKRSKEKTEAIQKKAAENKERRSAMAENISERNLSLAESTRAVVSSLSLRDQITFWKIADTVKDGGVNAKGLVQSTDESMAGVNRSIKRLKKYGLIAREGSKKTGRYVLVGDALLRSRCYACRNKSKCQGTALKCPSFSAPVNTKTKKQQKP